MHGSAPGDEVSEFIPFRHRLALIARAPWLQRVYLLRLLFAFAVHIDALVDWAFLALKARYPSLAPPDALPALGRERGIRRGFAESLESYAARLITWLVDRRIKGSPYALMNQLAGYFTGYAVRIRVVNVAGTWYTRYHNGTFDWHFASPSNWDWDGTTAAFSRYWVIVYVPTSLWSGEGLWGQPVGPGGGVWGDGGVWGLSATYEQGQTVEAIIRDWNPPHARCAGVIVTWDLFSFDPSDSGAGFPDGTWDRAGADDGAGNYVLTRPATVRFTGEIV